MGKSVGELEHKLPVQAETNQYGHVPHLMRTDDPRNDCGPIQAQGNRTQRVSHASPHQRFDKGEAVPPPEHDARNESAPAEHQENGGPHSEWQTCPENRP